VRYLQKKYGNIITTFCEGFRAKCFTFLGSKVPRTTLQLQVKLKRTHRQKKKTNQLKNKRDQRKKSRVSIENK
jgi:hypothetical protein